MTCTSPNGSLQGKTVMRMAKKNRQAHITPIERVAPYLENMTIEEAESVAIEILAQVVAKRIYIRGEGVEYFDKLMDGICSKADEYARSHASEIALSKVIHGRGKKDVMMSDAN